MKLGQSFLKASDLKGGEIVKFLDGGHKEESTVYKYKDGKPQIQFVFTVEFKGEKKTINLNKISRTSLQQSWGDDTDLWVGKEARVTLINALVGGEYKNIIGLTAV